jgi:RHS repeat-associated protein
VYNALGQRVEKHPGTAYTELVYDAFGSPIGSHNRTTWATYFVPFGGRTLVRYQDNKTYFLHPDHLGSTTFVTDQTGATIQKTLYYPWGQAWASAGTVKDTRFASMDPRDAETGNDPTLFRLYNPRLYRWLSPDPLAGDILNPQSLNRYAYVLNNPTNLIDPLGLQCTPGAPGYEEDCPHPGGSEPTSSQPPACYIMGSWWPESICSLFWSDLWNNYMARFGSRRPPGLPSGSPGSTNSDKNKSEQPCVDASVLGVPGEPNLVEDALVLSRLGSWLTGETVGIGIGGAAGVGVGRYTRAFGGLVSASALVVTDRNRNSGIYYSLSPQLAGFSMHPGLFDLGAAANIGMQVMVSSRTIDQLSSPSGMGSYANGPLAIEATLTSLSVTYGFGAGSRVGAGGGATFSGVIPICHE